MLFTEGEMQDMRAFARDSMIDTCYLVWNGGFDHQPGGTGTYSPEVTIPSPCRKSPIGSTLEEKRIADQFTNEGLLSIVLPYGTDVAGVDRVVLDGIIYELVALIPPRTYAAEVTIVVQGG